MLAIIV